MYIEINFISLLEAVIKMRLCIMLNITVVCSITKKTSLINIRPCWKLFLTTLVKEIVIFGLVIKPINILRRFLLFHFFFLTSNFKVFDYDSFFTIFKNSNFYFVNYEILFYILYILRTSFSKTMKRVMWFDICVWSKYKFQY